MTKSKIKSLIAIAHISYAGMLFSFRKYEAIENILNNGLKIAQAGKRAGDDTCQALIIQFYNFKASNYQLNKKNKEAVEWFCKSAEAAIELNQALPAITAYRQASFIAKKLDANKFYDVIERGYNIGKELPKEQLSLSEYPFLSFEFFNFLRQKGDIEKSKEVDSKMTEIFGLNWKEETQKQLINSKKPSLNLAQ
jgi:hypothetical protein